MKDALILLLAGFTVVFCVLILLIAIVTLYSKIVREVQNKVKKKPTAEISKEKSEKPKPKAAVKTAEAEVLDDGEIPGEIIAVIAAAVDAVYGAKPHKIKAVKKSRSSRSAWARAGAADNTRPF